jgi:drug/metabolite transporter (DMT)-like permease
LPFTTGERTGIFRAGNPGRRNLTSEQARAARTTLIAAFAAVYIVWGSTYLAIRFAIETIPPFLMAGTRFLVAGALLFGWAVLRRGVRPRREQWIAAAVTGTLLLMGGNGGVTWAEQRVPSGVAALMVAIVPCWMVLIDWLRPGGRRPSGRVVAGLLLGLGGIALLVGPESLMGGERIDPVGALALVIATLCWASGSIYSRQARFTAAPVLAAGMQMLVGGSVLVVVGLLSNEAPRVHPAAISLKSVLSLGYLILVGAIVGYSAYLYLLQHSTPARAATYAYVNPVVAVLLGWAFAGEPLTPRMGIAALVIVGGVAIITIARQPRASPGPAPSASGLARQAAED